LLDSVQDLRDVGHKPLVYTPYLQRNRFITLSFRRRNKKEE
jgi:hypothetical protein